MGLAGARMSRSITVRLGPRGNLVWHGHDLGSSPFGSVGSEYEWWRKIPAKHMPALLAALGGEPGDDVARMVRKRFRSDVTLAKFAKAHGIPSTFDSWVSTDWGD
jgi:hypothetical protein